MTKELAEAMVTERTAERFSSLDDVADRVAGMSGHEALKYLTLEIQPPTMIASRATVSASGVSRTVRMLFTREEKIQFLSFAPLVYRRIDDVQFNRWQYE
jgi:hypothetical protein